MRISGQTQIFHLYIQIVVSEHLSHIFGIIHIGGQDFRQREYKKIVRRDLYDFFATEERIPWIPPPVGYAIDTHSKLTRPKILHPIPTFTKYPFPRFRKSNLLQLLPWIVLTKPHTLLVFIRQLQLWRCRLIIIIVFVSRIET